MKKILTVFILAVFLSASVVPIPAAEAASVALLAPSFVLLDGKTMQIIEARAPRARHAPASTTKLLTVITALDHLSLDQVVLIPSGLEFVPPSKIGLHAGERFYVRDLVRAALIKSANDAAEALAIATAGSKFAFARLMNQKAKQIGANDSHYVNPSGLPAEAQYSTAYDLARIVMAATRNSFIVDTLKTRDASIRTLGGRKIFLRNCNKMLWRTNGVIGKTGWTRDARHCFAGRIQTHGRVVFIGIMGSLKRPYLWYDLMKVVSASGGKTFKPFNAPVISKGNRPGFMEKGPNKRCGASKKPREYPSQEPSAPKPGKNSLRICDPCRKRVAFSGFLTIKVLCEKAF